MTTPSAKQLEEIRQFIRDMAKRPCILSVHGQGRVCAPCEARLRVAREDKGKGIIMPDPNQDHWIK